MTYNLCACLSPRGERVAGARRVRGAAGRRRKRLFRRADALPLTPQHLADLLALVEAGSITQGSARTVFAEMAKTGRTAAELVAELGLEAVSDSGELEGIARSVIDAHPKQADQFRAGEEKVLNFLLGKVMRETQGRADAAAVREVLVRLLG